MGCRTATVTMKEISSARFAAVVEGPGPRPGAKESRALAVGWEVHHGLSSAYRTVYSDTDSGPPSRGG
jgi:hypothetical protein